VLKRLERQRLVRKRLDPRDGRRILLSLTDQGRSLDVEEEGTVESAVQDVLSILPRERIDAARDVLSAIARSLEKPTPARGGKA
jgi:DNA-binding MarR family transcriptional regulator